MRLRGFQLAVCAAQPETRAAIAAGLMRKFEQEDKVRLINKLRTLS
jgi:hypothetical protein